MIPSPPLPWYEIARFQRSRLTRIAVVAVAVVPLLYGALYVWANINPTGNLDQIKAAVVNHDQMVEVEGDDGQMEQVAVGRLLAANLVSDEDENNYDWVLTDEADAEAGLREGTYKAVLTIPENLSTAATSTGGDPSAALQGNLDLRTNDAVNFVNGQIADRILDAARAALNAQVAETYLDNLYLGFNDIKSSLSEAVDGATELAEGADELASGTGELAAGTAQLAAGANELASGLPRLAAGAQRLDDGASALSSGLSQLQAGTSTLTGDAQRLADGAAQVAGGTAQVNTVVQQVTGAITGNTDQAKQVLSGLETNLRDLAQTCRDNGGPDCTGLDAAADQVATVLANVDAIAGQATQYGQQAQQLADGAQQVADGNAQLAGQVPTLVSAINQAAGGANALSAATGALASGAAEASAGATELANGANELNSGVQQLDEGAQALAAGANELADGLQAGVDKIPSYSDDEREKLAKVGATPITDTAERLNSVATYGDGLAPYFMALALWVGAMSIYLLLRPLSARALASTAGSIRTAMAGFIPGAAIAMVQVLLLVAVLLWVVGIHAAQPWLILGIGALTALVFVAMNQAFIAWFGGAGRFLAIVFVCIQLAAAGGTYPIETSPGVFGVLHHLLPMTYAVHGLRAATAGGTAGVGTDVFALTCFGLLALAVTVLAARRQQRVTITRLHPTLVV